MLGMEVKKGSNLLEDNNYVISNNQHPSSSLHKNHNYVEFNKAIEAIVAGYAKTGKFI